MMKKLLLASLLVMLGWGYEGQFSTDDDLEVQKAGFWAIAALIGATIYSVESSKSQTKKAIKSQEKQLAAQMAMQEEQLEAEIELAGQQQTLTEKQMKLQVGQRQIEILANLFDEQDRTEPEIYYLPTAEPTSPFERINLAIDDFVRK